MENTFKKRVITFSELLGDANGNNLDSYFKNNAWELQEWTNDSTTGYQVFFGPGVQVDNLYEYGFPYLYDKEDIRSFAISFFDKFVEPAMYVSFWDTGAKIEFPCKVNLKTKEVYDIALEPDVLDNFEVFQGYWVRLNDGSEFQLSEKGELAHNKDGFWFDESKALKFLAPVTSLDDQIKGAAAQNSATKEQLVRTKEANIEQML